MDRDNNSIARSIFCKTLQFCYGYAFGSFMWYILVHPYARFYDFESTSSWPEVLFSLSIATVFMAFQAMRAVMVLFLPSMIGSASQNYLILLIFVGLFSNPLTNVALNAVETGRVIGCSLSMTFEQLKERAKLILNPIVEILNNENQLDLLAIEQDLLAVSGIIMDMRHEAEFDRVKSENFDESMLINATSARRQLPKDTGDLKDVIEQKLKVDPNTAQDLVDKTKKLIQTTSLDLDRENLGFKVNLDVHELRRLMDMKRLASSNDFREFNLTEILYENCLGVFRNTKELCGEAVDDIRRGCRETIGSFLSTIFCSPITLTLNSSCPWIMNQLLDETSICNQMREYGVSINVDPFNITNGASITSVYKNLTQKLQDLDQDLLNTQSMSGSGVDRLELNVSFNNQTKSLFFKANELVKYIREKYSMRQALYDLLLLIYEIYTSFTFLYIITQAYQYRMNYLTMIRFDNYYITGLFVAIDEKRRLLKKASLLPLTRDESQKYIPTFTCYRRTNEERQTQRASCTIIVVFLFFTLSLLYFDNIFYSILESIEEHALIQYQQIGHNQVRVNVTGEGAIARLVRGLTARLDSVYDLNRLSSTKDCLPQPRETSYMYYLEFVLLVLAYIVIDQISIYAMRLRHTTAAFFYPDKEKQRIVFLYKLILLQRQSIRKTGLDELIAEENSPQTTSRDHDADIEVYTIRDAIRYINACVSQSLCCARHSR